MGYFISTASAMTSRASGAFFCIHALMLSADAVCVPPNTLDSVSSDWLVAWSLPRLHSRGSFLAMSAQWYPPRPCRLASCT
jgi:hypothetical protein